MNKIMCKNSVLLVISMFLSIVSGYSQLEAGVKGGVNTFEIANEKITIFDDNQAIYDIQIADTKIGFQGGLYTRLTVWKLFLQLEALLNSNSVSYTFNDLQVNGTSELLTEQYTNLNIPAVLGLKFKWFNLQAGVTGLYNFSTYSELISKDPEHFSKVKKEFTYGFLGGFGLDIKRFRFDARYELNTSYFGDHIEYKGEMYKFSDNDNRIIVNLGYRF